MSNETEQRVMSERRPQGPPPTPRNPALEGAERLRKYAALDAIAELGSDDPAESLQKRPEPLMYTGEAREEFYARRQPLEALWTDLLTKAHRVTIGKEFLEWK